MKLFECHMVDNHAINPSQITEMGTTEMLRDTGETYPSQDAFMRKATAAANIDTYGGRFFRLLSPGPKRKGSAETDMIIEIKFTKSAKAISYKKMPQPEQTEISGVIGILPNLDPDWPAEPVWDLERLTTLEETPVADDDDGTADEPGEPKS